MALPRVSEREWPRLGQGCMYGWINGVNMVTHFFVGNFFFEALSLDFWKPKQFARFCQIALKMAENVKQKSKTIGVCVQYLPGGQYLHSHSRTATAVTFEHVRAQQLLGNH